MNNCRVVNPPGNPAPAPLTFDLKFSGLTNSASGQVTVPDAGNVSTLGTAVNGPTYAFDTPRKIYGFTVVVRTPLAVTNETMDFQLATFTDGLGSGTPIPDFSIAFAQTGTPPDSGIVTFTADTPFTLPVGEALGLLVTHASGDTSSRTFSATVKVGATAA